MRRYRAPAIRGHGRRMSFEGSQAEGGVTARLRASEFADLDPSLTRAWAD